MDAQEMNLHVMENVPYGMLPEDLRRMVGSLYPARARMTLEDLVAVKVEVEQELTGTRTSFVRHPASGQWYHEERGL